MGVSHLSTTAAVDPADHGLEKQLVEACTVPHEVRRGPKSQGGQDQQQGPKRQVETRERIRSNKIINTALNLQLQVSSSDHAAAVSAPF